MSKTSIDRCFCSSKGLNGQFATPCMRARRVHWAPAAQTKRRQREICRCNPQQPRRPTNKQSANITQEGVKRHSSRTDQSTMGRSLTLNMVAHLALFFWAAPVPLRLEFSPLGAVRSPSSELMMRSSQIGGHRASRAKRGSRCAPCILIGEVCLANPAE